MTAKAEKASNFSVPAPVLIWGGVAVIVWVFGRQLLDAIGRLISGLKSDPSITPTNEPSTPARTGVLTAVFIEPANNGHLWSAVYPPLQIKLKIAINNPKASAENVEVKVAVTWYPRAFGEAKSTSQATTTIVAPPGRTNHDVYLLRPGTIAWAIDAVGAVSVNGMQTGSVLFAVD